MSKLNLLVLNHYRFWQIKLIVFVGITAGLSIAKHLYDWPHDDSEWLWVEWLSHVATLALVLIVLFFRINIDEVRSLYHSASGLNQILDNLQEEDKEVQSRLLVPLIQKMAKDRNGYGTLLININDPSVRQMISNTCSKETDERLIKLAQHSSTAAQDAHINFNSREIRTFADEIKQFEMIKEDCDKSTP